jgi:hypothetical protein
LPSYLSQRKELLRAAGLTTRSLSKPCTIKVVETCQELEQILDVRFAAYKAAAKTPPGATSAMMEDEYDTSSILYCAKYGPDVIATMRANVSKNAGQQFPFENILAVAKVWECRDTILVRSLGWLSSQNFKDRICSSVS